MGAGVIIAILDTGVDASHPDHAAQFVGVTRVDFRVDGVTVATATPYRFTWATTGRRRRGPRPLCHPLRCHQRRNPRRAPARHGALRAPGTAPW